MTASAFGSLSFVFCGVVYATVGCHSLLHTAEWCFCPKPHRSILTTFDSGNIFVGMRKRARKKSKQNRVSSLFFYVKLSAYETYIGFSLQYKETWERNDTQALSHSADRRFLAPRTALPSLELHLCISLAQQPKGSHSGAWFKIGNG